MVLGRMERDVAPGVHRVCDSFVNWYVVEEGGWVTVVDTGLPTSWESLHGLLASLDLIPGDLAAVIITHAHLDHLGFAERARTELGVTVWIHGDEVWLSRHPLRYKTERQPLPYLRHGQAWKSLGGILRTGALLTPSLGQAHTFEDGDTLEVPGRPRVVYTPGHTFGHCSFHFPDRDAVVCGDALITLDPYTGATGPRVAPRCSSAVPAQALRSLDRLEEIEAQVLLPGHGEPWREGTAEAVRRARAAGVA
jgi:glyoxylase-like metal-dependent hydrolase (beta-lactamase superfamily II)